MQKYKTREEYLQRAYVLLNETAFKPNEQECPAIKVSCSFIVGTRASNKKTMGQCAQRSHSDADINEIRIVPTVDDSFEAIDLSTMLFDFGLDFNISENIALLFGSKYHTANGNELVAVYDNYNNPLLFEPVSFNDDKQMLNSLGFMVEFNERSTLTASASTFSQVDERDYKLNQFQILYRLNF